MFALVAALALLIACNDTPEPPPTPYEGPGELLASIRTTREYRQERLCLDAGRYRIEAHAPDGEPAATAIIMLDDGSADGEFVEWALRSGGEGRPQRIVRKSFTVDESGLCYWLSIQTGIHMTRDWEGTGASAIKCWWLPRNPLVC